MSTSLLPDSYPNRLRLNDELHARPPVALWPNEQILYLALIGTNDKRPQEEDLIRELCDSLGGDACPMLQGNNIEFDVTIPDTTDRQALLARRFRVKYERHSEFSSWWFIEQTLTNTINPPTSFHCNLDEWLCRLPGKLLVAMDIRVCQVDQFPAVEEVAAHFDGNTVVGSLIAHESGAAFTDFRIGANGRSKFLFLNRAMGSRQAGRLLQGLVEIETYRMMSLITLPLVHEAYPQLSEQEATLVQVSRQLTASGDSALDQQVRDLELQEKISQISSSIEAMSSSMQYRLSASDAYFQLVQRRILDLRETNLSGIQGFGEFMERRLLPAIKTCSTFSQRLRETSHRVSRISQLLQTRVEIAREAQNSQLLASMEQRSKLQLHLQQAVEGLSIVAISYYGIGLAGYLFKALKAVGVIQDVDLATGIATPLILLAVAFLTRRIRNHFR